MSKLRGDTLAYASAQAGERLLSFFLLPVLTKTVSPAEYAIWTQSVVIAGVLTPVVLLGFQTSMVKFAPAWDAVPRLRESMLLAMLAAILGVLAILAAGTLLFASHLAYLAFGNAGHAGVIPVLIGLLFSEALFEFLVGMLRSSGRIKKISLYGLLKGVWRIALLLVFLHYAEGGFAFAFAGFVVIQCLIVLALLLLHAPPGQLRAAGFAPGQPYWQETLAFSLPLVPLAWLTAMNNFVDRFFLAHLRGLEEVAVYAAASSLAGIAVFFYSVPGFTLFPELSRNWARGNWTEAARLLQRAVVVYLFFLLPFLTGLALLGPTLLQQLTTSHYLASSWLFLALGVQLGLFGLYQIALYVTLLGSGGVDNLKRMLVSALLAMLLNALLVPGLGGEGAALAGCLANALLAVLAWRRVNQLLDWAFSWRDLRRILARTLALAALLSGLMLQGWHATLVGMVGVVSFAALFYLTLDFLPRRKSFLMPDNES